MRIRNFLSVAALTAGLIGSAWARPFHAKTDLKRCLIGNQAGLLKVVSPQRKVLFTRGIDDRSLAILSPSDREQLLKALEIEPNQINSVAESVLKDFARIPGKEAVALLSVLATSPDINPQLRQKIETFLVAQMSRHKDVAVRRQAILALAVLPQVSQATVVSVIHRFETCENLWETFPIQQFFEYHAPGLRTTPELPEMKARVTAVRSLYTPAVLHYLDS